MPQVEYAEIVLPDFGPPQVEPEIPVATYEARLRETRERAAYSGYDALLVYGDREHLANIAYLTGYDPRFEEALLILAPGHPPTLLVGNEGMAYAALSPVPMEKVLYQSFSLPGQPRGDSKPLATILREAGVVPGLKVGVAGWKYFLPVETATPAAWIEAPAYLVDTLRELRCTALNATALFMDPAHGLRAINDLDQLARFEYAATLSSEAIKNVLFHVQPGMTEYDAVRLMGLNGFPLACHPMCSAGARAVAGLPSPSSRVLREGDPATVALGLWGALNARAGFLVRDADGLPSGIRDYIEKLVAPYFRAIVEWYEAVGIGVTGGELFAIIDRHLGDPFFGVGLNPGHLIHLDEWLNSPIFRDSRQQLRSGMALQVDIIPATHSPYFTTNIEDGIALADEPLRASFAAKYPEAWGRIEGRRTLMRDTLGIHLKPEVLPFSNIPAYLPPFWLSPQRAMRVAG
ncbi:MAG: aminopeptidase P family N-terminal domain-containing protein [Chloroflexota bacterium]|nr:aminopeptidase P family N-terminal domain-containing protein [Chloroflexota bacterium]